MALDPRIALETKVPDIGATIQDALKGNADRAFTQQQTANAAAQQGGLQAESDQKVKAMQAEKWISDNAKNPDYQDQNPDGTSSVNQFKLVNGLRNNGYAAQAQEYVKRDLTNMGSTIKNSTDMQDAVVKSGGYMAALIEGLPQEQQAQAYDVYRKQLSSIFPSLTPGGASGGDLLGPWAPGKIQGLKDMVMGPTTVATNKIAQQNVDIANKNADTSRISANTNQQSVENSGVENSSGPEYRDPNSKKSVDMRAEFKARGIDVPDTASASDMKNSPQYKTMIDAQINPAASRTTAATSAQESEKKAIFLQTAVDTASKIQIPAQASAYRIGDLLQNKINSNLLAQPDQDALKTLIQQAKDAGIPINENSAISSIGANFNVQLGMQRKQGKISGDAAKSTTTAGTVPEGSAIRVISPDGKQGSVKPSMLSYALSKGYRELK